ncbi:MAG TPA: class I SAM-dependent methyltransferase [Bacteroidia bacterium]|nr:class I SAM-dependent methyltransferase [Bacteroidia bacterium]
MQYDPIKRTLGNFFNQSPFLRKLFYRLLDLLLLRAWHIHLELRKWIMKAPSNPKILDAGMGFGQYTYFMAKNIKNAEILAVDVKEEQIADCRNFFRQINYNNVNFQIADLTKFTTAPQYDLVLCVDVMEHILEDITVFKNYVASMKNGGMLLISTPSDQGGSDVHDDGESSFIEEHVRDGYNIKEIENKLKEAGFSKVEARYSYGSPGKIAWRLSMKYPILMLGVSKLFFVVLPFYFLLTYPFAFILNYFDTHSNHSTGTGLIVKAWK